MTQPTHAGRRFAGGLALAFGLATVVATFAQCGNANGQTDSQNDGTQASDTQINGGQSGLQSSAQTSQPKRDQQDPVLPPPDAVRILISGSMLGRLEPCGCASGQLGGLARRMQHIGEQRNYDLLIEGGDLVAGKTELDKLKLFTASSILFQMERPYDAIGVGLQDLSLPLEEWSAFLLGAPAVATNLTSQDPSWPATASRDKTVRKHEIRIASLLLADLPDHLQGKDAKVQRTDPVSAWQSTFAETDPGKLRIALLHGNDIQIRAIIPQLQPKPDLAIGVDPEYIEPEAAPAMVGKVPLVFAGIRGRVLLDARLWREGDISRVACETVPLAGSKTVPGGGGDPDVKNAILQHRTEVAEMDVLTQMAEQSKTPNGDAYVGSQSCAPCHPSAMKAWQASKHAHAWQTLVKAEADPKRYGWPVTKYPDCVGCHVVGYGQESGFKNFEATPNLVDVGCERCHGPASGHVQSGGTKKLGIIGGVLKSQLCTQCHDFEQSPEFVYGERWKLIEHGLDK